MCSVMPLFIVSIEAQPHISCSFTMSKFSWSFLPEVVTFLDFSRWRNFVSSRFYILILLLASFYYWFSGARRKCLCFSLLLSCFWFYVKFGKLYWYRLFLLNACVVYCLYFIKIKFESNEGWPVQKDSGDPLSRMPLTNSEQVKQSNSVCNQYS